MTLLLRWFRSDPVFGLVSLSVWGLATAAGVALLMAGFFAVQLLLTALSR